MPHENVITTSHNVLLVLGANEASLGLEEVMAQFCGEVVRSLDDVANLAQKQLYVCGDLELLPKGLGHLHVIEDHAIGMEKLPEGSDEITLIDSGQVPLLVHGVGVMFKRLFGAPDLFDRIQQEHTFQHLTESTKPSKALRTGIYLTDVTRDDEGLHFRLLRCSSNLTGPTDNFRDTDRMIMEAVNQAASHVFEQEAALNHVLAQIYQNSRDVGERARERKAKIGAHSDKTKDMPREGVIAFCTFYDPRGFGRLQPCEKDPFDWCYKQRSGLTTLHFKLKPEVKDRSLVQSFSVTLYPNSVFIIPLSTNRLYTHEIRPSMLNVDYIPTRMGYVARCSNAEAQFVGGETYLKKKDKLVKLVPMSKEPVASLRQAYYRENSTAKGVDYGEVDFSMNEGDYKKPMY